MPETLMHIAIDEFLNRHFLCVYRDAICIRELRTYADQLPSYSGSGKAYLTLGLKIWDSTTLFLISELAAAKRNAIDFH